MTSSAHEALLGASEIRALAAHLDLTPTKRLGQNFVHDANTVRRIVRIAGVSAGDAVVEIGPGLGSLTLGLTAAGCEVTAVEIDPRLAALLPTTVARMQPEAKLQVIEHDAMTITELPTAPSALVANLPYNVSVPVLLHFLELFPSLQRALVMVQSEVGHRLGAVPGSKVYGSPSAKAAWYGELRVEADVSRAVFWPVPNVDSVLVGFHRGEPRGTEAERKATFQCIDAAFGQRRKMLRQSLSSIFGSSAAASAALERAGIAPTARAEEIDIEGFVRVGAQLLESRAHGTEPSHESNSADGSAISSTIEPESAETQQSTEAGTLGESAVSRDQDSPH